MRWPAFFDQFTSRAPGTGAGRSLDVPTESDALFDEALLERLRRLILLSRSAVSQGITGEHRSRRKGASPEFADFKNYAQGDDFRRIDWNIYSRLDALFIRLSEVTTELTVHILIDASRSMDWRSSDGHPSKFAYARRLAGSLAYVSLWHFDRVVVTPFSNGLGTSFGPVQGRAHIQAALHYLEGMRSAGETDLLDAVQRYVSARRHPSLLVVISDLLSGEPESLREAIRHARTRGWQVSVIHIVDAAELAPGGVLFPDSERGTLTIDLIDLEDGGRLRLAADDAVIERYQDAVDRWKSSIEQICASEQADYVLLQTDWPFEQVVLQRLYETGLVA
ncbi:MAG: DUF58 domain-containing protein [Thermomicrobiales bacterium]|nr:DUF58 domain-containing protein [Thermomicrobiales bacterium]